MGIPIALILVILGAFGVKTYTDASRRARRAETDVAARLEIAQKRGETLQRERERLAADNDRLTSQLADSRALAAQVKTLTAKIDRLTPSSKASLQIKNEAETALARFRQYLQRVGYASKDERVEIDIPEKTIPGALAYYEPDERRMVVDRKYAADPDVLYREYMHHILSSVAGAPAAEPSRTYRAIESALATYFASSFNNDPRSAQKTAALMGQTFVLWDLSRPRRFDELEPDVDSPTDGMEIWGSAFWEIRRAVGQAIVDKMLFNAWRKLDPAEVRTDGGASFVRRVLDADRSLTEGKHQDQIRGVFERRGLKL